MKRNVKKPKTTDPKVIFRRSKAWKTFRDKVKKRQKKDPITGSPLTKTFNLHHLCLAPEEYSNIEDESRFIGLNATSHDIIHYLWGDAKNRHDWRERLKHIVEILELMDEYNETRK